MIIIDSLCKMAITDCASKHVKYSFTVIIEISWWIGQCFNTWTRDLPCPLCLRISRCVHLIWQIWYDIWQYICTIYYLCSGLLYMTGVVITDRHLDQQCTYIYKTLLLTLIIFIHVKRYVILSSWSGFLMSKWVEPIGSLFTLPWWRPLFNLKHICTHMFIHTYICTHILTYIHTKYIHTHTTI